MAAIVQNHINFVAGESSEVEAAMRALSARGDGAGWLNLGPALTEDQHSRLPSPSTVGSWFSARGPIVPMATWTPAARVPRRRPVTVGIEHGVGPKALDQLRDAGLTLPDGWRKVQDHAKRGIVAEIADSVDHRAVLEWLLSACWALCGIEIDDHWTAVVNSPES